MPGGRIPDVALTIVLPLSHHRIPRRSGMPTAVGGIHHITALASDPQKNVDFYTGVLGLRLVKTTVNFDAPDVYHLYYGDEVGQPGTILTFFPFPDAVRGKRGTGEISAVAFLAPRLSLDFWAGHLWRHGIRIDGPVSRFGEQCISFGDPEDMQIELVFEGGREGGGRHWEGSPIPRENALTRIGGVTLTLRESGPTEELLAGTLGFRPAGRDGVRLRFNTGQGAAGSAIDIVTSPDTHRARQSAGSVHHIAWRTPTGEEQREWRLKIREAGLFVTEVLDRNYFQSIYFREPGEVLFEIATDPPGFTVDETPADLGTQLKLPSWLEPDRARIERVLPPLRHRGAHPGR
jgi:glyoxalase family protein